MFFAAKKYLEPVLSEKAKELNISDANKHALSAVWEKMERFNFELELVPTSFRAGRINFDYCVDAGKFQFK